MPIEQLVALGIGLVVISALAGVVAWATAQATGGASHPGGPSVREAPRSARDLTPSDDPAEAVVWPPSARLLGGPALVPGSGRQVARVVAFLFLASVAVVTALTRAWPGTEAGIFTLLAAGTLLVVLFMDLLPGAFLGRSRRLVEGLGAIAFLGLLMGLTGGIGSPFVVGFYLVVAGTALSSEGLAPLAVAVIAAATLALVSLVASVASSLEPAGLAWLGIHAVTLLLLADLAAASARAQRQARDQALRASRFDVLTGLFNRSFFFSAMEQEIRRSERMGRGFTMLMLDLDDLKPVNDTFGHQWGDRLLTAVADVLRRTIRFTDTVARYGGDEFLVLLPETDAAGAYVVAETIRRDIAELSLRAADRNVRSSVSIGLVTYPDDGATMEQLVAAADVAMYESKRRGKNQIVGYRTRTDRVATAIPVASAEDVPLGRSMAPAESRTPRPSGADEPATVSPGGEDAPWLTRTDGPARPAGASQDSQGRARAEHRSPGQEPSRGDEIRRARERYPERPWIALPIEHREPPAPPTPPGRPRS